MWKWTCRQDIHTHQVSKSHFCWCVCLSMSHGRGVLWRWRQRSLSALMEVLGTKLRKSTKRTLTTAPSPKLHLSLSKAITFTLSSLPLFCSFFSRLRTAFPLSLWRCCADGRWALTTVPGRLLCGLGSLYWEDWRFLGPGEGLNNTRSLKSYLIPEVAGYTPS